MKNKNSPYQLTVPDVEKIWDRIQKIRNGNPNKDSQGKIGADYSVSKKTIGRIALKESWKEVTDRLENQDAHSRMSYLDLPALPSVPEEIADLWDYVAKAKVNNILSPESALLWGWYDSWDGKHHVVTDGVIMWDNPRLVELALKLKASNIDELPFLASNAVELPTFALSSVMTLPIGPAYQKGDEFTGGIVQLISEKGGVVCIQSKFFHFAETHKYQLCQAGDSNQIVYLTKSATTRSDPCLLAAIAVME